MKLGKNRSLCIGRQLGSDGREIGREVAEELGIRYYDKEILQEALSRSELPREILEPYDEKKANSLLHTLYYQGSDTTLYGKSGSDILYELQKRYILEEAQKGPCVFIGRCADAILREAGMDVLSVFIAAPYADRMERVKSRNSLPDRDAGNLIQKTDRQRRANYEYRTGRVWGDPAEYDLLVNSSAWDRKALVQDLCRAYHDFVPIRQED